jgi:hypothetical protein
MHKYVHKFTHAHINTYIHTYVSAVFLTQIRGMHTCIIRPTYVHTHTQTHTHTPAHKHTRTWIAYPVYGIHGLDVPMLEFRYDQNIFLFLLRRTLGLTQLPIP